MIAKLNTFDMERKELWRQVPLKTPFLLAFEPTFACNFHCGYCMHSASIEELEQSRGFKPLPMDWKTFMAAIEQSKKFPDKFKKITFAGNGEPLLNPDLSEMVKTVHKENICDKSLIITNGSLLNATLSNKLIESGLSELKISMQGLNAEKYKQICGVEIDFDSFYENIKYFYKNKKNTILRIKIADTALDPGEDKIFYQKFGNLCDYIAVEHIYTQFYGVHCEEKLLPDNGKTRFGFNYKPTCVCGDIFFKMSVLRDGMITFGCPDGVTYAGFNVNNMTLYDAWNSKEFRSLLYDHLTHNFKNHPECIHCTRWDYLARSADLLDGHETDILTRMNPAEWNFSSSSLSKETIMCYNS